MAKLSKTEAKLHKQAEDLIHSDKPLSFEEKEFILTNWNEAANHVNGAAGAFFTPYDMTWDVALHVCEHGRVIDLCAGIGGLSFAAFHRFNWDRTRTPDITCIEINPNYATVGKRVLPEANWIIADVFDVLDMGLGKFTTCMSNPPFGRIKREKNSPGYNGAEFEFHVIDIASRIADCGVFVLPTMSAGFRYSGAPYYERQTQGKAFDFQKKSGLFFECAIGVDTEIYRNQWKGTSPSTEIVYIDFEERIIS